MALSKTYDILCLNNFGNASLVFYRYTNGLGLEYGWTETASASSSVGLVAGDSSRFIIHLLGSGGADVYLNDYPSGFNFAYTISGCSMMHGAIYDSYLAVGCSNSTVMIFRLFDSSSSKTQELNEHASSLSSMDMNLDFLVVGASSDVVEIY